MQRKKLRRRKRPQLSVWGASVQDIADSVHDIYASAVAEAGPQALVPELVGLLKRGVVKGA